MSGTILFFQCGADYVKTKQAYPNGLPKEIGQRCCSVDGDADRLMYYYLDDNDKCHLLDGDRIAILIAEYLKDLVQNTGININLGIVQTAYANGASTEYIENTLVRYIKTSNKICSHWFKTEKFNKKQKIQL